HCPAQGQLLGVAAPGARRDPGPALLAGRGVDAVVDDGVVVVALLVDASAHGAVPFDVDSERDATQRSRPIPRRPTGGALPTSTIPRSNRNVESRSLEPAPSRRSGTHVNRPGFVGGSRPV